MTYDQFLRKHFPLWAYTKLKEESQKQGRWTPDRTASSSLVDHLITWKDTEWGQDFWQKIDRIVYKNFNNPVPILNEINKLKESIIPTEKPVLEDGKMTVEEFTNKYFPVWLRVSFKSECLKQSVWEPNKEAESNMIDLMLRWSKTIDGSEFWSEINEIVHDLFDEPKLIEAAADKLYAAQHISRTKPPEQKLMTNLEFIQNYIPHWLEVIFVSESQKQNSWISDAKAQPCFISNYLIWSKTPQNALWAKVHAIVRDNFYTPEKICKLLNDLRKIFSENKEAIPEVQEKQTETKDMTLQKYEKQIVAKVTLVEGVDISDLAPSSIISQIKAHKRAIKDLEEAGIVGAYLNQEKANHELAISTLQDELNGRVAPVVAPVEA